MERGEWSDNLNQEQKVCMPLCHHCHIPCIPVAMVTARLSCCSVHLRFGGCDRTGEVECADWWWQRSHSQTAAPQTGVGHLYSQEPGMAAML